MSSAYSITASVNPPRAVYLDYPLGHTAGKPLDLSNQRAVMRDTLSAFEELGPSEGIRCLPYEWRENHGWKERVMRPEPSQSEHDSKASDDRVSRHSEPQYQTEEDALLADQQCPTCVFPTVEDRR